MGILIAKHFSDYSDEHAYYGKRAGKRYGAIVGAGAGAAIGRRLGGKTAAGRALGTIAGGAVGAGVGFLAGSKLGKKIGRKIANRENGKRFEVAYMDNESGLVRHKRFEFIQDAQMFQRQHLGSSIKDLHQEHTQDGHDFN